MALTDEQRKAMFAKLLKQTTGKFDPPLSKADLKKSEVIFSTNIFALGAPFLERKINTPPILKKELWYESDFDDGLSAIHINKKFAIPDLDIGGWQRSGRGWMSGRKFLIQGKNLTQENLNEDFERAREAKIFIVGFDGITSTCKKCGETRELGSGDREKSLCKLCSSIKK